MRVCVGVSVCMKACSVNVCVCVCVCVVCVCVCVCGVCVCVCVCSRREGSGVLASSALVHVAV